MAQRAIKSATITFAALAVLALGLQGCIATTVAGATLGVAGAAVGTAAKVGVGAVKVAGGAVGAVGHAVTGGSSSH
jgi:hypothetical protein